MGACYVAEKPNVEPHLVADDEPEEVMTTFGPQKRLHGEHGIGGFGLAGIAAEITDAVHHATVFACGSCR